MCGSSNTEGATHFFYFWGMKKVWLSYCIPVLLLIGCSGETITLRNIKNSSEDTLRFQLYRNGGFLTDTILLLPAKTHQISITTGNRAQEDAPDCSDRIDSAYYEVFGGGTVTKEIRFNRNWETESEQTKTVPPEYEHTCTFTILDSDILRWLLVDPKINSIHVSG